MSKKIFVLLIVSMFSASAFGQISFFQGTWSEALAKAKKENKLLFVDAYAAWCGPCRWMSNNVFPDKAVGEYYNEHFINYKIDMEKGEGPQLATTYRVTAYPTLLYIDADGMVKHRVLGAQAADGLISSGKVAVQKSGD